MCSLLTGESNSIPIKPGYANPQAACVRSKRRWGQQSREVIGMAGAMIKLWVAFIVLLLACTGLQAQTVTGAVLGRVTDPSNAPVPGAAVNLTNTATNESFKTLTGTAGDYEFPLVLPGQYRLVVSVEGFREFERDFSLDVNQQARVDVTLTVGKVTEKVFVTGQAVVLETDTSSLGQVVETHQVADLPLNGRNPFALVALTPGVTALGYFGAGLNAGRGALLAAAANNFQSSGGITGSNEILLDGLPITVCCQGQPAMIPSIDVISEFKVQTDVSAAEFGRTSGGILNIISKTGGNSLHGTIYEFLRNEKLDANDFFSNLSGIEPIPGRTDLRPPLRYNQAGFSVGGPVVIPKLYDGRNKTFFFGGFERTWVRKTEFSSFSVPTMAMRSGDLSASPSPVYDPTTTKPDPSNPGQYLRTAFANNQVPVSQVAASYLNLYPTPTTSGIVDNFSAVAPRIENETQGNVRVDHYFTQSFRSFVKFGIDNNGHLEPNFWKSIATPSGYTQNVGGKAFVWDNSLTLTPNLIADLRTGFAWQTNYREPYSNGTNLVGLGFSPSYVDQLQAQFLPPAYVTGFDGPAENSNQAWSHYTSVAAASITWVHHRHTIKAGWDGRLERDSNESLSAPSGEFYYGATFTNGPNPFNAVQPGAEAYLSFASFLLGIPNGGDQYFSDAWSVQNFYNALYIQDDFKVTPKLTLNLGLRWDIETGVSERHNRIAWLDPSASNPLAAETNLSFTGAVQFACQKGNPCQRWETAWKNPGPRVGFAYSLTNKTVVRGGYGIYYLPTMQRMFITSNPGFQVLNEYVASLNGVTPIASLSNPFPLGLNHLEGAALGPLTAVGGDVDGNIYKTPLSYLQQWNVDVQRQLPGNIVVDAAYAGNHGLRLPIFQNLDSLNPTYYGAPGDQTRVAQLVSTVPNPFYNLITTGALSTSTVQYQQLLLKYPQFTSFTGDALAGGYNLYDALELRVRRPFAHGLALQAAYTWSKNIGDINNNTTSFIDTGSPAYQYDLNQQNERSVIPSDVKHTFVTSVIWEVPYGRGKKYGSNLSGPLNVLAGGWQMNAVVTVHSGFPQNITDAGAPLYAGSRPNLVQGQPLTTSGSITDRLGGSNSAQGYINPAAFSMPESFQFGTTPRLLDGLRSPGARNLDFSLFKEFNIREHLTLQFRAESFNFLNYVQFGTPGTTYGIPGFGVIGSQANDPRTMQLALKLIF